MLAKVLTGAVVGLDGALVEVDSAAAGQPNLLVVGLRDAAVRRPRGSGRLAPTVWQALPKHRITVNLVVVHIYPDEAGTEYPR
jgi:hypothetical protein